MRKLRCALPVVAVLFTLFQAGTAVAHTGPSSAPVTSCIASIIHESLRAPSSVTAGATFKVKLVVRNCTAAPQNVTLEGRLHAPSPCSAPVIDPLAVTLQPDARFVLRQYVPGESCTGTYTVTWSVLQKGSVLASRTRRVMVTG